MLGLANEGLARDPQKFAQKCHPNIDDSSLLGGGIDLMFRFGRTLLPGTPTPFLAHRFEEKTHPTLKPRNETWFTPQFENIDPKRS